MNNTSVSSHVPLMARIARVRACMLAEYVAGADTSNKKLFVQFCQGHKSIQCPINSEKCSSLEDFFWSKDDFDDWDNYSVSSD
jgi:hypothetical protein